MKVLYLTGGFPYPLTSGYLRHYHLIRELAADHEVTLLSLAGARFRSEDVEGVTPFTRGVHTFRTDVGSGKLGTKIVRRLRRAVIGSDSVDSMGRTVRELTRREVFDVVVTGKQTVGALQEDLRHPIVADLCDATSHRIRRAIEYSGPVRRVILERRIERVSRQEQTLAARAAHTLFISARDRDDLSLPRHIPTTIVPNGIDLQYWARSQRELGHRTIVFTGAMDYRPNTDAALYLIRTVFPEVLREMPGTELLIVGRDPTPALRKAGEQPGVTVTGFVDDVRPYLERATVFAAPIRVGSGMQNKVLEALAMEVPVVASALAADGLRTEGGDHPPLDIADDLPTFVRRLCAVLKRTTRSPHHEGREFVARHYTWESSGQTLDRVLRAAVAG